ACAGVSVAGEVERVLFQKIIRDRQRAGIVEVLLARDGVAFERLLDLVLALTQILFAGLLNVERDQYFVVGGLSIALHAGILQSGAIDLIVDGGRIGSMRVLYIHQRPPAEVDAQRDAMPERHGHHSGHAEDQREGQEVPLFPEKIDACVAKKFQVKLQNSASSFEPRACSKPACSKPVARSSQLDAQR